MTLAEGLSGVRSVASRLAASRGGVARIWAAATLVALALLAGGPGISRDEAAVLAAGDRALRGPDAPASPAELPAPPLAAYVAGATRAGLSPLGLSHLRAARLGTAILGALLSAALALLAWEVSGAAAAFLAPALFWAVPRHLHAGLVATPDLAAAALSLAATLAYRRAALAPEPRRRLVAAVPAGLLFGAALAARADAWVLLPALALHAALSRFARPQDGAGALSLQGAATGLVALATLGPAVLIAVWPAAWGSAIGELGAAFVPSGPPGKAFRALRVAALSIPATVLLAYVAGVVHALSRFAGAVRGRTSGVAASDEALLLLCAAAPFVAAAAGVAPALGGVRASLAAMPFLALLGARALLAAARVAWPARTAPLTATLALLALWPAIRATAHFHPTGSGAWNELARGAPGAAALGLERQDGGDAAISVIGLLNERAQEGARVYWPTVAPEAVLALARDGRLRGDLIAVGSAEEADLAVVTLDGVSSRDAEYRTWSAFRTARPAAGTYLDEVPIAFVYARPGAWR